MNRLIRHLIGQFFSSRSRHFLVLLQNNNELRSAGGYITSVFDVELGKWQAKKMSLDVGTELFNHEKVEAPKPIVEMLFDSHLDTWTFRDSNYDPDFNESAKKAIEFYHMVYHHQPVSGLLMANYGFVEELLRLLGPIRIGEDKLTHLNLFEYLSARSSDIDRKNRDANDARKNALSTLANKIILKSILRPWKWFSLWRLVNRSFDQRELQFFDPQHPQNSEFRAKKHQDFFSVIENNYLGLKSNRYIERDITHDTEVFSDGGLKNTVRIRWRHLGIYNYPLSGEYRGHVRFYIPIDAKVKEEAHFELSEDHGFKVVSFKFKLIPKESLEIKLVYELPESYCDKKYQFKFFRQSGVQNEDLQKTFALPVSMSFADDMDCHKGQLMIRSYPQIEKDQLFETHFGKSRSHPRIYAHDIVSRNQILIKFNEQIHLNDVEIKVQEKGRPENIIIVKSAKPIMHGKWLLVELEDFPEKEEVFYSVQLKDIKNRNGISITPNPRTITVVYRPKYFAYWKRELKML